MAETIHADKTIDARGSYCPGPLMELIKTLKQVPVGTVVEVWSSDAGSKRDIPQWAERAKQELVYIRDEDGYAAIGVRKVK
ncbi:MAG: sulfurtransferase TusA family protein [Firmicutes bacterium]|nr:sulfurtransferase TusA family protein [Bacillota bacterium]